MEKTSKEIFFFKDWRSLFLKKDEIGIALFQVAYSEIDYNRLIMCSPDNFFHIRTIFSKIYMPYVQDLSLIDLNEKKNRYFYNKLYEKIDENQLFEKLEYFVCLIMIEIFEGLFLFYFSLFHYLFKKERMISS